MGQYQDRFKNIFSLYQTITNDNDKTLLSLIGPYLWQILHKEQHL